VLTAERYTPFHVARSFLKHTDLLNLQPLPITALQDTMLEDLYAGQFTHFNPIQTQIFHTLYHTNSNVLIGAPTGSGTASGARVIQSVSRFASHRYLIPPRTTDD